MKQAKATFVSLSFILFVAAGIVGCAGPTGGDRCEKSADCGSGSLECVANFSGTPSACATNKDQPLICATPCETDADCEDAEFGHKAAPVCLPDCAGNKSCIWDPGF